MKLVFAHDHVFMEDDQKNLYTGGSFNNQVWKRYLNHFDEVTVIARLQKLEVNNDNKTYNDFNLPSTNFVEIPSISGPKNILKNKKEAKKRIKKELMKSDALIARLPSEIGNLAIEVAKELNLPYAVEVVACVWDALWNHGNLSAKIYAPLAFKKMQNKVKGSSYVLYVTESFLQNRYPTNGENVNVSNVELDYIDINILNNKILKVNAYQKDTTYKIGMIGSLKNNIKGWTVAFDALKKLENKNKKFEFYVLGDGDTTQWEKYINQLSIKNNVEFTGVLPGGEAVYNWLDNLDIYIQPSYQEGLPRAVIEAMSRGLTVIASTAGGIPELIDNDYLHAPGDSEDLARLLNKYIDIPNVTKIKIMKTNFYKSLNYEKSTLDKKRSKFWDDFLKLINKN